MTRLQPKISSLTRAAEHHIPSLCNSIGSLSPIQLWLHPQEDTSSSQCLPSCPNMRPTTSISPSLAHRTSLPSQSTTSPPSDAGLQLLLQSCSNDLSLDLPPSLKATLKEALSQQPWESSDSDSADRSWQALSSTEPPSSCDLSFDPLTYMPGDTSASSERTITEEGEDERVGADTPDEHLSSLKGMLRFVNQTLANQDDPSVLAELPGVVAE